MPMSSYRNLGIALACASVLACSSNNGRNNDTGGKGGTSSGGSGGKGGSGGGSLGGFAGSTGGAGGGGSAGTSGSGGSAGAGGSAGGGGAAGSAGSGGASGAGGSVAGSGGGGAGGEAGNSVAGSGGAAGSPDPSGMGPAIDATKYPPGPAPGSAEFLPGTSATINKLVSADPTAGYFYGLALGSGDVAVNVETLSAADATGLPTGITHAAHLSSPVVKDQTVLFGFNFRPNNGKAWQYVDASQYAGITFWAKVGGPMLLSVGISSVDATNIAESEEIKGACPASTRSDCTGIHSTETTIPTTWQQFKLHWADLFATGLTGDVDPKRLYRYDIIHTATESETKYDLFVTGIKFATAAELN